MAPKKKRSNALPGVRTGFAAGNFGTPIRSQHWRRPPLSFEPVRIEVVRALTESDLEMLRRSHERPAQLFNTLAKFLDLILEPDEAESTIGNLAELYARRLRADPGHAQRWLVAQVVWIVFGRAMDVFRRFMRARAGK